MAELTWCTVGGEEVDLVSRVEAAVITWEDAAGCATELPTFRYAGPCTDPTTTDVTIVYGDPDDVLEDGVLAASVHDSSSDALVLNDLVWGSDADAAAGICTPPNLDLLLRHEIGHYVGLPHTCDDDGTCISESPHDAVMAQGWGPCDGLLPTETDLLLLRSTLGPVDPRPVGTLIDGPAPATDCFAVTPIGELPADTTVTWSFGDGGVAAGLEACHTWEAAGTYQVDVTVHHGCGEVDVFTHATVSVLPAAPELAPPKASSGCALAGSTPLPGLALLAVILGASRLRPAPAHR